MITFCSSQTRAADDDRRSSWKERRRLERSRTPHEAGPQLSDDERAAKRAEARKAKSERDANSARR